ncbi:MAG: enoyl-CoA hydratase/isomerase [Acidobacteria bacterium]|nr:enoyl-CoA hydratase/isomerase [Acidobacteriota bacterium]
MFELTQRGPVAVLRMAHGKANAMDLEFCRALSLQVRACEQSDAGALVLTGQGRIFSAGVDLPRLVEGGSAYAREFLPAMNHAFETLFAFPKPLVVAVNGHAIAGGCVLTCCADYRIMARDAGRIGIPELLVGVPFPVAPLEIVRFATPPQHLQALIYRGLTLSADEALRDGLIDAVGDPDGVVDAAVAVAAGLAEVPYEAFHLTKRLLREPAIRRMRDAAGIDAIVHEAWAGDTVQQAVRDYVARTLKK